MTKQELELLISLTSKKIYSIAKDNNLTDAEYDYYIYIASFTIYQSVYVKMLIRY